MQRREKGSGSIWYNQERKRYIGQFQVGVLPNGRPKLKTISGKTKKEVKDKIEKLKAELITGLYTEPSKMTIVDIATSINEQKKAMNIVGQSAYLRNKETIKIIKNGQLGGIPISKLAEYDIINFLSSITDYSNSVISKVFRLIKLSMKKAVKLNIIRYNFADDIVCPKSNKQTKKVRALTVEEQKDLIKALNQDNREPFRTMLLLALFTGMRIGEIGALNVNDINIPFKTISVTKTLTRDVSGKAIMGGSTKTDAGNRIINLNSFAFEIITNYLNCYTPTDLLFLSNGNLISSSTVNNYFRRLIVRYGISSSADGYNQHMLRHTFATRSIEAGMPPKVLQKILGHTDIKVTLNTYCDVFDNFETKYIEQTENYLIEMGIAK